MAHPSSNQKLSRVKVAVEKVANESYNYSEVKIESQIDARLMYTGRVSGKPYEWAKSGAVQLVDERDVPELLSKRIGERSCCGEGSLGNKVFALIE